MHPCVCCPFLTPSLQGPAHIAGGVSWAGPGAAKPRFLTEQSTGYFGSNDKEMSFSKCFVALLGNKGLFYC